MPSVLVIGLDGATWRVLAPWAEAGRLPHLAALMQRGTWGTLESTVPALTLPAWSTFMTGRNPGGHGIYAFQRLASDAYGPRGLANASDLGCATMWDVAGHAGRRVGVVNVPPSYPLRSVNGYVVGCMLTPPGQPFTSPPELADELPGYVIDTKTPRDLRPDSPTFRDRAVAYLRDLTEQTRRRADACVGLLARHPVDLFAVVLYAPDRAQHYLWTRLRDLDAPPAPDAGLDDAVRALFSAVDDAVGRLVQAAPEADVVVLSDHGFTDSPRTCVRLNRWLADRGHLAARSWWKMRRRLVRTMLPRPWRARYDTVDSILVDRRRTKAWAETIFTNTAGIWIHVAGRYPLGCVRPGADYDAIRDDIQRGLEALRDDAGRPVFRAVHRREALYRGPYVDRAPDLMVECAPQFGVVYESLNRDLRHRNLFGPYREEGYTGTHDPDGIYVVAGPSFRGAGKGPTLDMESIAPTVLHLLDIAVPRTMDGTVPVELLRGAPAARPVAYSDVELAPTEPAAGSVDGDADVAEHLRGLGYLE